MMSSSIRLSLTGGQVGWTTKMSTPADVLVDLDEHLAVGEASDLRLARAGSRGTGAISSASAWLRVPGEELQLVRP